MSMRIGHIAGTLPPALLAAVYLPAVEVPAVLPPSVAGAYDVVTRVGFFSLAVCTSWINDWDLSRYRDRSHPGAVFARVTARAMYRIRTKRDLERWDELARRYPDQEPPPSDLHRGPTHSIEWCLLVAGGVALVASVFPPTRSVAPWVFYAILLGTGGHVAIDSLTPSGVPGSMIYNYLRYGEVWRRHAVSLRWHEVGWRGVDDGDPITFRTPGLVTLLVRLWPLPVWREVPWIGIVTRTLSYPVPCVISVVDSREGCRPGLFYTDGCAEKIGFVPLSIFSTILLGLVVTGTFRPTMWALTGWPMFATTGAA